MPPKARPVLEAVSVDGVEIPQAAILAEAQNHPGANPGEAVRQAAHALVVRELLVQEARRQEIEASPEPDDEGRHETQEDALVRALIEAEIDVPRANEEECRRYFERNRERFRTDPLWQVRHILLAAREGDETARANARHKAQALCQALRAHPEGFAEAASAHSACSSARDGGSLGQISRGETTEAFEAALEAMRAGEMSSEPVETRYGYHIIALDRMEAGRDLPFEHVKGRIAGWLEAASWSRAVAQYVTLLGASARITGVTLEGADGPLVQ
nr:peptidylprolyl isomerase [Breoghania corrubedonensis]